MKTVCEKRLLLPLPFVLIVLFSCLVSVTWADGQEDDDLSEEKVNNNNTTSHALVNFLRAEVQLGYKSSDYFDPRGMEHLYILTNLFLDLIQPKSFPQELLVHNKGEFLDELIDHKEELVKYYVGFVVVAFIGALLTVIIPLAGLFFCLCRCAGKCGARPEPYEKRCDSCKRFTLGVIVSTFVVAILFGIVCAFVTNEYIEQGVTKLPTNLNDSLDDVSLYLRNTKSEINTLFVRNFGQLNSALDNLLDKSGETVKTRLAETSKASAIENLTNIVEGLQHVHKDLSQIARNTRWLHLHVNQLEQGLDGVRNRLLSLLASCSDSLCYEIRAQYEGNALRVSTKLKNLPDVSETTQRVADFIQRDIAGEVKKGKESLDRISLLIQEAVNTTVPRIKSRLRRIGDELRVHSDSVAEMIDKVDLQQGKQAVLTIQQYSNEYGKFRYYAGLGMCCAVLLITNCLICGLFCGFCGQKPHPYENETCNRATGASFLIAAVYLVFLLSMFLTALTTGFFLIGGVVERVVCDPVQDTEHGEIYQIADTFFPLSTVYPDSKFSNLQIADIVRKCHRNYSAYDVLRLDRIFNITDVKNYKERYNLDDYVDELRTQISRNHAVLILTEKARRELEQLAQSEFARIDFDTFIQTLKQPVTQVSLNDVQTQLRQVITHLEVTRPQIAGNLVHEAEILTYLQKEVVLNITKTMSTLKTTLDSLRNNVLFNKTTFQGMIYELLDQAEQAQRFIQTQGKEEVISLADEFTRNFTAILDEYADLVDDQVSTVIGQCGPVSRAFNASVVSVCKNIVNPFNGFWASIGWCVILFIPTIIISVSLASLYRKTDPYPGPLVESVHKKRRRRQHETYDNRNGYVPDYMLAPGDDAARFRREAYPSSSSAGGHNSSGAVGGYSRMDASPGYSTDSEMKPTAPPPSHSWNSNGRTPPDYERPPPYYFPGPKY